MSEKSNPNQNKYTYKYIQFTATSREKKLLVGFSRFLDMKKATLKPVKTRINPINNESTRSDIWYLII